MLEMKYCIQRVIGGQSSHLPVFKPTLKPLHAKCKTDVLDGRERVKENHSCR
jgi:hypothetical protein